MFGLKIIYINVKVTFAGYCDYGEPKNTIIMLW